MKELYLDESGNHNLGADDPQYPVFVLGGIIVDRTYARTVLPTRLDRLLEEHLGRQGVSLHAADMTRGRCGFEPLADRARRGSFFSALDEFVTGLDIKVVACAIDKRAHRSRHGARAVDPYHLGFGVIVERFCFELQAAGDRGSIVAERRGQPLDRELEATWRALARHGSRYVRGGVISRLVTGLELRTKADRLAGLQVADVVVASVGRSLAGKVPHPSWAAVEGKLRRRPGGEYVGAGLVVLPKTEGRGPLGSSRPE